jgi:diadenylate cyclase
MTWLTELLRRPPIGWWDIADIVLVSLIIYELLMLIRGTRAVQMALGAGVIIGLFYLSGRSQLQTINFLIRNLAGYVVFAVIVLFQADIRRALAHLGRAPFFRYFAKAESAEESIEEIIVAAGLLSEKRIGAIIAIERQVGLRNYIEGGIPLDATLTYDLLLSIFQPSSPLHDGAVIVQDDRIASAACFLPLTVNPKLSKDLGSRHRAAIGLTVRFSGGSIQTRCASGFSRFFFSDGRQGATWAYRKWRGACSHASHLALPTRRVEAPLRGACGAVVDGHRGRRDGRAGPPRPARIAAVSRRPRVAR